MRTYWVYIMSNESRVLYVGVTGDLSRRINEHKHASIRGFTSRYRLNRLVYFESTYDPRAAIAREKQLKRWPRQRKLHLIESMNADWRDLSHDI